MATNLVLVKPGTEIVFGAVATWNPADNASNMSLGDAITDEMGMTAIADGAGVHSIKIDLGATRAKRYSVDAAFDFTGETPTQGETVDLYWAPTGVATQGSGNVGGTDGTDAAAPSSGLGSLTLADFIAMCQWIGSLVIHDGASVQNGHVGIFSPAQRYGQMVVVNSSGDAFEADEVESHIVMTPIVDEIQAAV